MTAFAPNFSPEVDRDNAVPILASRFEELFALLVDAFANSLDNSTNETLGAPVGFNGQRLVSIANGQTPTDAATMDNLRSREGAYFIAAFNSVTNTYSVDFGPDYLQKIGTNIFVKFPTQNTEEAPLFQINGNAALPLFIDGFPVGLGGITAGMIANIIFADGAWAIVASGANIGAITNLPDDTDVYQIPGMFGRSGKFQLFVHADTDAGLPVGIVPYDTMWEVDMLMADPDNYALTMYSVTPPGGAPSTYRNLITGGTGSGWYKIGGDFNKIATTDMNNLTDAGKSAFSPSSGSIPIDFATITGSGWTATGNGHVYAKGNCTTSWGFIKMGNNSNGVNQTVAYNSGMNDVGHGIPCAKGQIIQMSYNGFNPLSAYFIPNNAG